TFANASFGSLGSPVIARVQGDASFSGTSTGYGILIVEGDLQVRGTFDWHGLLVIEGEDELKVDLGGEATIYGAVYVDHESTQAPQCVSEAEQQRQASEAVAPLASFPSRSGQGTQTRTIAWPGHPSVAVRTQLSKSGGRYRQAKVGGTTLQGAAQDATVGGVGTGAADINNPDYTGPRDLQLLSFHPGLADNWTQSDVRLTFDAAMTQPFYLHLFDLDQVPITIKAYDEDGDRVSTASWSLSNSMDVLLTNGQADNVVYQWNGANGEIRPSRYGDTEMIAGQLLVSNFADVREIRVEMRNDTRNRGELVYIGLSTQPFADPNVLVCAPASGGSTAGTSTHVALGGTQTPTHAGWAIDDDTAMLMYYATENGQVTRGEEGLLAGLEELDYKNRPVDAEAMTFADDGTLYFVNDGLTHSSGNAVEATALYRIPPSQLDGNPNTPVQVERIGSTRQSGSNDRVTGLLFHEGQLYGISRKSQRIYRLSLSTGEATTVRTFSPGGREWAALTRGADGEVYALRKQKNDDTELWRFDNFPSSSGVTRVGTLNNVDASDAMSGHPDGYLYVIEGSVWGGDNIFRVDPSDASYTSQLSSHNDTQAFAFYYRGEAQAIGADVVAPLHLIPNSGGAMSTTGSAAWLDQPGVTVSASTTSKGGRHDGKHILEGSSLATLAAQADRNDQLLGVAINNPAYTGPANLSTFNLRPGASSGGVDAEVRFRFDRAFSEAFFFHVIDLDKVPMTIEAFDAQGRTLSTAGWTMSTPVDLILENGRAEDATYTWTAASGQLRSSDSQDNETIAAQFRVDNYADVREIRARWTLPSNRDDGNHFALSSVSLYEQRAAPALELAIQGDTEIYYSTEALGQLATLLTSVESASTIVEYDQFGMDLRAVFETTQGQGSVAGAPKPRQEDENRVLVCMNGVERKVSPVALDVHLARGATEGACPRSVGTSGVPADPRALVDICLDSRTKQVRAGDLDFWLRQGARQGACSAKPPQGQATPSRPVDDDRDDDDRDDDDRDDDDRDDDDRDDDDRDDDDD
ncbi:MAG: hypothetical protein AAF624_03585, partial [Bacteroidota bacterium]